jgi:NAD(P)-dependent dehydrogenase (short-subunit alcohol dehydrogenase family)
LTTERDLDFLSVPMSRRWTLVGDQLEADPKEPLVPSVLVTGASRGIGRAAVRRLAAEGWDVFAGVRKLSDADPLVADGAGRVRPVTLDIASEQDVAALDEVLPQRLDAIINNAGVAVSGPLEGLPLDDLRRQLEINVVAQVAVTQAVLPRIRVAAGRVLFVSSVSGLVATPMLGAYVASKYAIEGLADVLRLELHSWRIPVILIEPSQTDTDMWRSANDEVDRAVEALRPEHRTLYAEHIAGMRRMIPFAQKMAVPVDNVVDVIMRALITRRPRARYVVGAGPRAQVALVRLLPTPVVDLALRKAAGIPRAH